MPSIATTPWFLARCGVSRSRAYFLRRACLALSRARARTAFLLLLLPFLLRDTALCSRRSRSRMRSVTRGRAWIAPVEVATGWQTPMSPPTTASCERSFGSSISRWYSSEATHQSPLEGIVTLLMTAPDGRARGITARTAPALGRWSTTARISRVRRLSGVVVSPSRLNCVGSGKRNETPSRLR
jgi:hypothetical protein